MPRIELGHLWSKAGPENTKNGAAGEGTECDEAGAPRAPGRAARALPAKDYTGGGRANAGAADSARPLRARRTGARAGQTRVL